MRYFSAPPRPAYNQHKLCLVNLAERWSGTPDRSSCRWCVTSTALVNDKTSIPCTRTCTRTYTKMLYSLSFSLQFFLLACHLSSHFFSSVMKNIHESLGGTDQQEACPVSQGSNLNYSSLFPRLEVWVTPHQETGRNLQLKFMQCCSKESKDLILQKRKNLHTDVPCSFHQCLRLHPCLGTFSKTIQQNVASQDHSAPPFFENTLIFSALVLLVRSLSHKTVKEKRQES